MEYLVFTLSMPNVNTWNGRWSGEGKKYAKYRHFTKADFEKVRDVAGKSYSYRWEDGWRAMVSVEHFHTSKEAQREVKGSDGFLGYDWMIDSILEHGEIKVPEDLAPEE